MQTINSCKNEWFECDIEYLVNNNILHKPLDGNHGEIHPKSSDFVDSGIPFVMASDIADFKVDLVNCNFITKAQADKLQKGFSIKDDVLFTHKGSVGGTAIVPTITIKYIMLTPQVTYYRVKDYNKLNNYFIYYYFQSTWFQKYIKTISGGGTRAYIGITAQLSLPFILPPLPEQNRIVAVLETWDNAIELIKKKIEAKKRVKKGLMQQLLTGKKRMAESDGGWKIQELKSIATITKGKQLSVVNMIKDGIYPVLNGGISISGYTNRFNAKENTITISEGGNSCGYVNYNFEKFWCGGHCYLVVPKESTDGNFLFQILKYNQGNLMRLRVGSGLPNIQKKSLDDFKILITVDKHEQGRISDVLVNLDRELKLLEHKLVFLKYQKKYFLNNLITGKIRTPENLTI